MKEQYNELFKEIHLSETAKEKIREQEEQRTQKLTKRDKCRMGFRAAALVGIVFLGSTGIYAATHLPTSTEKQSGEKWQVHVDKGSEEIAEVSLATRKPENSEKEGLCDIKLSYIPHGFKQDKEDTYFYRRGKKDENGFFSVILYHMKTDYRTIRRTEGLKKFQTEEGQGIIADKGGRRYIALLQYNDSDYMICIDGCNMPKKEVRKIAENASLFEVSEKKDIQASYIEWTSDRQKKMNEYIEKIEKMEKEYADQMKEGTE